MKMEANRSGKSSDNKKGKKGRFKGERGGFSLVLRLNLCLERPGGKRAWKKQTDGVRKQELCKGGKKKTGSAVSIACRNIKSKRDRLGWK